MKNSIKFNNLSRFLQKSIQEDLDKKQMETLYEHLVKLKVIIYLFLLKIYFEFILNSFFFIMKES